MDDQCRDKITVGTWARITGFTPGEEEVFHIVSDADADLIENKIPPDNPLARALMGAQAGRTVIFRPPGGEVELTVLELGRSSHASH
jgi:transcription elongation GreA/GreB family factor